MRKVLLLLITLASIALVQSADAATCFWVGGTGTWSTANTASWASATGGTAGTCAATGGAPKQSADTATFDGSSGGGTVTVDSTINGVTLNSIQMTAFTGTLDFSVNTVNLTVDHWVVGNGTQGTRTLKLGAGTYNFIGSNQFVWDCSSCTSLTLTAGTSTLNFATVVFSGEATFVTGGLIYANVIFNGTTSHNYNINGAGATFGTLSFVAPVRLATTANFTITNKVTWNGSASALIQISSGTVSSITFGTSGNTGSWVAIDGITAVTNSLVLTNSFNMNGNSNVTISGPSGGVCTGHIIGG